MKNGIRMIALLLVLGLLAGCGNGQFSSTDGATGAVGTTGHHSPTNESTGGEDSEPTVTCQYLPEKVDNPNNVPVLKWVCLTNTFFGGGSGNRLWNEQAVLELNQMLADRNMPFRVQFVMLTIDQYMPNTQDWFAVPDAQEALKDADLIYAGMNEDTITAYLTPITEYVTGTAQPSLKNAVPHERSWLAGTVGTEIYGYGTLVYRPFSSGWQIDSALLQAAGLTPEELQRDFWEMDDVFAKLYAANGNRPFLFLDRTGTGGGLEIHGDNVAFLTIDPIDALLPAGYRLDGSFFAVDYTAETPAVVNYLETAATQKLLEAAARYIAVGYTTEDTDDALLSYGDIYEDAIYMDAQDNGKIYIPVTDAYFTHAAPEGFITGVAAVSQHKEAAVSLLSLIAEDEAFRMQLFYGKEGRDYKLVDGYYEIITHEDGSDYSLDFLSPLSYFSGLTATSNKSKAKSPGTNNAAFIARDGKTVLLTYQEIVDGSVCGYSIRFDYTGFEQELAAMEKVFNEKYSKAFRKNTITEEQRQQLVADLKAAGSDKVLAALQSQLAQWQADHPDW